MVTWVGCDGDWSLISAGTLMPVGKLVKLLSEATPQLSTSWHTAGADVTHFYLRK